MTQAISRSNLKELHSLSGVCDEYKKKIERYLTNNLFSGDIDVSQEDINKAFNDASVEQKAVLSKFFKKTSIITDINTWQDVLEKLGVRETSLRLVRNPKNKESRARNAFTKLLYITKAYNGDWAPDWINSSQYKYYIYKYFSGGAWSVSTDYYGGSFVFLSAGLYFETREKALDSYEKFEQIYNEYFMIG